MNNAQKFEIAKMDAGNNRLAIIFGFTKTIITAGVIVTFFAMFFTSLDHMVLSDPARIAAIGKLVTSFGLSKILVTLVGLGGVTFGAFERRGKKRAVEKLANLRRLHEMDDSYNAGSGLNKLGETPK